MAQKIVTPSLGEDSFSCPHPSCSALAHQTWHKVYLEKFKKDSPPSLPHPDVIQRIEDMTNLTDQKKTEFLKLFKLLLAKKLTIDNSSEIYTDRMLGNLFVSCCYSCGKHSIWVADNLIYPSHPTEVEPHEDMPQEIQTDFLEAASIVNQSSRGAAALLRLCIQKLMIHLGMQEDNINNDIGSLVKSGLDDRIQKALDVVRVIGNNAVHPGNIDLKDDKKTAMDLFALVNLIVQDRIATPKHIEKMYGTLPDGARKAIEKRDGKNNDLE